MDAQTLISSGHCLLCGQINPVEAHHCMACGKALHQIAPRTSARPVVIWITVVLLLVAAGLCGLIAAISFLDLLGATVVPGEWISAGETFLADYVLPDIAGLVLGLTGLVVNGILIWGIWTGQRLARVMSMGMAVVWALTGLGVLFSAPVLILMLRKNAKEYFGIDS